MMQLAIDTSTEQASIALFEAGGIVAEVSWRAGQNHTVQLLPHLDLLLSQHSLNLESVSHIIVAKGPGSYNGLRVGVSTAKALAFSLGLPLIGISTLEAAAYQHAETGLPICPMLNAGRSEIATAAYQMCEHTWHELEKEHLTTLDALCARIKTKTVFCGEMLPLVATELRDRLKDMAVIPPLASVLRRAGFLAELGLKRIQAGAYDDATGLQPLYIRQPAITKPKHR